MGTSYDYQDGLFQHARLSKNYQPNGLSECYYYHCDIATST